MNLTTHPLSDGTTSSSRIVRAFLGDRPEVTPVWFMRQAGRSLPEYRLIREGTGMIESCLRPDLAAEITLQPVRRHHVDAAVFFSDIVVPLRLAGVDVDIAPGVGPVLGAPIRTADDIARLEELHLDDAALAPIREAVELSVAGLAAEPGASGEGDTPLIGFGGAPFTLAAYLVEGRPSRDHLAARALMHADPDLWARLLTWCAQATSDFLVAQVRSGASAVQLFDSWAGSLSLAAYERSVAPFSRLALEAVHALDVGGRAVPVVHFGTGTGHLLGAMRAVGADVVGVDHRTPLSEASAQLGHATPLQGNIDPSYLFTPRATLDAHVHDVLRSGLAAPAHVVNLGHGVPPDADPDVLTGVVRTVHAWQPEAS
ncbi:uroporphyrinogen decarboxylase [Sanguibacter sp. A247]|uniref:uroporphyrinogen decarboxylase n=1 Tax=unclassified Sanguibacter TaxID=2645534 RepID=UPI003FD75E50